MSLFTVGDNLITIPYLSKICFNCEFFEPNESRCMSHSSKYGYGSILDSFSKAIFHDDCFSIEFTAFSKSIELFENFVLAEYKERSYDESHKDIKK